MKKIFLSSLAVMLAICFALAGFGCASEPTSPSSGIEIGTETTLEDIISGAEQAKELSYDMYIVDPDGNEIITAVYIDGTKMRQETKIEGREMIFLGDSAATMYVYYPDEGTAMKIDLGDNELGQEMQEDPYAMIEDVVDKVKVIGHETIDGKKTTVIQYDVDGIAEGITTKMWVWEKHGIPIKVVTTGPEGTTTVEFKNIKTGNVSDDLFELPAGVNVIDLESMFEGGFDPSMFEGFTE